MEQEERRARMGLAALCEPLNKVLAREVLERGVVEAWERVLKDETVTRLGKRAQQIDIDGLIAETEFAQARFVIPGDAEWPGLLDTLHAYDLAGPIPHGLWVRGLALDPQRPVTITGSRACTAYGAHVAEQMAADLAQTNTVVTSLSYGVDVAALRGAVGVEGFAPVVMTAAGMNHIRLTGDEPLVDELVDRATVVSELPPATVPSRAHFLARNRLLAAMSHATVLVEAAARSGARMTLEHARALGRVCLAVPGPITSIVSAVPNRMISDRDAGLVSSASEVVDHVDAYVLTKSNEFMTRQEEVWPNDH